MKEIEHLSEDNGKLQQISDLATNLRCPHTVLEEAIRDLQLMVQRQLSERQANDSQLNVLELNVFERNVLERNLNAPWVWFLSINLLKILTEIIFSSFLVP